MYFRIWLNIFSKNNEKLRFSISKNNEKLCFLISKNNEKLYFSISNIVYNRIYAWIIRLIHPCSLIRLNQSFFIQRVECTWKTFSRLIRSSTFTHSLIYSFRFALLRYTHIFAHSLVLTLIRSKKGYITYISLLFSLYSFFF